MGLYDYLVKDAKGNDISMKDYSGKLILVVNTATGCGFTPQYEGLQHLYEKYQDKGFEILDFPCNQFASQAPGTEDEIQSFCSLKYNTTFKLFSKINVNGIDAEPLFTFLKQEKGGLLGDGIKWNFTKFLIDQSGKVIKRYAPTVTPDSIEKDIAKYLK